MKVRAKAQAPQRVAVFTPHELGAGGKDIQRIRHCEAHPTTQVEEVASLKSIVVEAVLPGDGNLRVAVDQRYRIWAGEQYQVQPVLCNLVALKEPHGESRGDEIPDFRIQSSAIRADAAHLLGHCVRELRLIKDPRVESV